MATATGVFGTNGEDDTQWLAWYLAEFKHTKPGSPDFVVNWITRLRDTIRLKLEIGESAYTALTRVGHTLYFGTVSRIDPSSLNRKTAVNLILPLYEVLIETPQYSKDTSGPTPGPELWPIQIEAKLMATCFQTEMKSLCSSEILRIGYAIQLTENGSFRSAFNNMLETSLPKDTSPKMALQFRVESDECSDPEIGTKMVLGEFEMTWEALKKLEEASDSGMAIEQIINGDSLFDVRYKHFIHTPGAGTKPAPPGNGNTRGDAFRRIRNSIAHTQYYVLVGADGKPEFVFRNKAENSRHTHIVQIDAKNFCDLVVNFMIYTRSRLVQLRRNVFSSYGIVYP